MKSLAMKLDALSKIGVIKQYTLEQRLSEYNAYPDEEHKEYAIKEALEYSAKGFICNEFILNDGVESVTQWQTPSVFIKNCYHWFVLHTTSI
jgi:hypothetical protein